MESLVILQNKLKSKTRESEIFKSIIISSERTLLNIEPSNIENMINDIESEFKYLDITEIQKGIRNGSLGHYGLSYRFCSQTVCFWIREYLKSKKSNLGI